MYKSWLSSSQPTWLAQKLLSSKSITETTGKSEQQQGHCSSGAISIPSLWSKWNYVVNCFNFISIPLWLWIWCKNCNKKKWEQLPASRLTRTSRKQQTIRIRKNHTYELCSAPSWELKFLFCWHKDITAFVLEKVSFKPEIILFYLIV